LQVAGRLPQLHHAAAKLALVHERLLRLARAATQRLQMTGAEAPSERRVISVTKDVLDFLEAEGTLANIIVDHERVVDDDARLQEEAVLIVCVLVNIRLVADLARHLAADSVLAEI